MKFISAFLVVLAVAFVAAQNTTVTVDPAAAAIAAQQAAVVQAVQSFVTLAVVSNIIQSIASSVTGAGTAAAGTGNAAGVAGSQGAFIPASGTNQGGLVTGGVATGAQFRRLRLGAPNDEVALCASFFTRRRCSAEPSCLWENNNCLAKSE